MAEHSAPRPGEKFQFICIQNPDDAKNRATRRLARSHAIARGLEKKRRRLQQAGRNFRTVSLKDETGSKSEEIVHKKDVSPVLLSIAAPGPFQLLAAESPSLQALISQHSSERATEPILSVSDELVLQNFQSVLRKGLDDRALLYAVMLTYTSAVASSSYNDEHFIYRTETLSSLRQSLRSSDEATSEPTLGAILLLAGIEARLGMPRSVQLHLGAIQQLLDVCQRKGIYLGDAIKRAIFWQDLNCSVMTGSTRIVDHTTFSELKWTRYPLSSNLFVLPPGFKSLAPSLGEQFIEILEDVHALQCIRDNVWGAKENVISMAYIDNHQANIQSRLVEGLSGHSSFSECCHLALYLCSSMLRCKIWRNSVIPSHLSLQLLHKLQQLNDDSIWDEYPGLSAWMLYIGGAFAPVGPIQSDYMTLLHENRKSRLKDLDTSWPELLEILKQFIWSERAFASQVEAFWRETST
ncbi:uncharacterized protein BHQ10_008790 [Talaromyces amestolkiae]|uniref:Transcription factor domain-containing protein n=1 Tax=Talaromyces amestolkiae TaxID=1196081 RepID=A0A364LAF2_TALAM|nr:uncharacterized protein BHQ10_008790 [Talaromyces amestolkiae]RAO72778.1 hypothetical protein BHQ10_008790 [Talaromyces amestolkiae]